MKTTVTELEDSRARIEVEVPADEVSVQVQRAARALAREMRMPGFRKGKAPPSLAIQRLGYDTVFQEAIQEGLPEWYQKSVYASGVVPIGSPDVEITKAPTQEGETVEFKYEVGVRPNAELGEYKGLEVEKAGTEVPDEVIDREIDRMREGMASLDVVDRAAEEGDHVLVDFVGSLDGVEFEGGSANDHTIEIGSGQLIDDFEEQIIGAKAGDEVAVNVNFPEEYGAAELAGQNADFKVTVKEVRVKQMPEADDDFASEASEFDTIEELRADIAEKLGESAGQRIEQDFRVAAVDAAVKNAKVGIPEDILRARGEERWERVERQMAQQGMNPDTYLQMQGKTRDEIIDESLDDADMEIRREAVLVAVADAEGIEVTDEEMAEELEHAASHERTTGAKLLERLKRDGRHEMVIADIKVRKAMDVIADSATATEMSSEETVKKLWGLGDDEEDSETEPSSE
ncbi:MAG TPA: trigger factor [Solirubrobacterales bacterium]|nr:trigger factor [Solirubrobacterales bacterium]HMX70542.1 trigger factor [Solirubrobacterales bacterium]HMY25136.1 trigger factor [Solirubrobacterales bacterium]HNA23200.1 trigger factor [Solirubrobacterales bacterium]HNA43049.1 trigger factor [Solirubrobacterales bacterium]